MVYKKSTFANILWCPIVSPQIRQRPRLPLLSLWPGTESAVILTAPRCIQPGIFAGCAGPRLRPACLLGIHQNLPDLAFS